MSLVTRIIRHRGDTYPVGIVVDKDGVVINVTGFTSTLSVSADDKPAIADYLFQSTGTVMDGVNGKISFPITDLDVDAEGEFYFDVQLIDTSGYKHTPINGVFELHQDISK